MIRDCVVTHDAGLPVVSWTETRSMFGREAVQCRIKQDKRTGELMFVAIGAVRDPDGRFEEGRPWKTLTSFKPEPAVRLYQSPSEQLLREFAGSVSRAFKIGGQDGGLVLLAQFEDGRELVPMHLNCAECRPVELHQLQDVLQREFITRMDEYAAGANAFNFVAPRGSPLPVYDEAAEPERLGAAADALLWAIAVAVVVVPLVAALWWLKIVRL